MATDLRAVTVTGRVGTAPERKQVGDTELVEFSLAVTQYRGPKKEADTAWYSVNLWGGRSKVADYITVGMKLTVSGELTQSSWQDKETGKTRRNVHIDATSVVLPDKGEGTGGNQVRQASGKTAQPDDELPF